MNIMRADRGDTIVEVLIAMAIIGAVLASAFGISNRSTQNIQDAQERSQALKLAQTQIELMRTNGTFADGAGLCYYMPTGSAPRSIDGTAVPTTKPADCKVDATGQPTTGQPQYTIRITTGTDDVKTVAVTWPSLLSGGDGDSLSLFYRPNDD